MQTLLSSSRRASRLSVICTIASLVGAAIAGMTAWQQPSTNTYLLAVGLVAISALMMLMSVAIRRVIRERDLLVNQRQWLTESIQQAPEAMAAYGPDDQILAWSQPYEALYGTAFGRLAMKFPDGRFNYADLIRATTTEFGEAGESLESIEIQAHIDERLRRHRDPSGHSEERRYPTAGWQLVTKYKTPSGAIALMATSLSALKYSQAEVTLQREKRKATELKLHTLANRDLLTGTITRPAFIKLVTNEVERSCRYDNPMSVLMMDLAQLEQITATHGELVADQVFAMASTAALAQLRNEVDVLGRLAGDKFGVLLPQVDVAGAQRCAERICERIAASTLKAPDGTQITVSARIGVSSLGERDLPAEVLIGEADQALQETQRLPHQATAHAIVVHHGSVQIENDAAEQASGTLVSFPPLLGEAEEFSRIAAATRRDWRQPVALPATESELPENH